MALWGGVIPFNWLQHLLKNPSSITEITLNFPASYLLQKHFQTLENNILFIIIYEVIEIHNTHTYDD